MSVYVITDNGSEHQISGQRIRLAAVEYARNNNGRGTAVFTKGKSRKWVSFSFVSKDGVRHECLIKTERSAERLKKTQAADIAEMEAFRKKMEQK